MNGFVANIEKLTRDNSYFRKVIYTGKYAQVVLMCLKPNEEIGLEVHDTVDQFFRVDEGTGEVTIDGEVKAISDGTAIVVPAGSAHNLKNTGQTNLKLYTVYSPPNHPEGTIHQTLADAVAAEAHH